MGAPARKLGKYELVARIGEGGMAEVHLARQRGPRRFHKLVVVKTVHSKLLTRPALADALLDEARIAAMLKHPNVVDIYDLGEEAGIYFIAMEYLEGESLATILRASRAGPRLDPFSTARILADCAAGLHAAHELRNLKGEAMELVHQDVTPGNVIVLYTGQVKLVDFGVAKVRTSEDASLVKGKAGYLAPELFEGKAADRRSDVFAAGVVLWEALTLRRLFHSATEAETFRKIRTIDVPPPSRFAMAVTRDLDDVCLKALARDPAERYQTAREMHDDLTAVLRAANWGGDNEPIARFMRTTFATQIAARASLLRDLDADGEARLEVLEQIMPRDDDGSPPAPEVIEGAHGRARVPTALPDTPDGEGEVLAPADRVAATGTPLPPRRRLPMALGLAAAAVALTVVLVLLLGRRSSKAAEPAHRDAGEVARVDPLDAANAMVPPPMAVDAAAAPAEAIDAAAEVVRVPAAPIDAGELVPDDRTGSHRSGSGGGSGSGRDDEPAPLTARSLYKDGLQKFVGGDTATAIARFRAALAKEPGYAPAHRGLGMAFERNGDRPRAVKELETYLRLAPTAPDAPQIRSRLDRLR